jgi:aspartyl-tRNA(Asn)/glutamyl-tRNA(Gln) amidotransferase subunit A
MPFAIETLTIKDVHKGYIDGTLSVKEVVSAYLKSARAQNPDIHAYLEIYDDTDAQIAYAEQLLKQGKSTPVTGIPFAIKDNFLMQGKITTAASKILAGHRSTYDATVVARLKQQGAIIIGRANMDEMAMGSTTENSAYGITKNPLDTSRVPGGSSGGSAAAVAMHGALAALGSDTGGSVRLPASTREFSPTACQKWACTKWPQK